MNNTLKLALVVVLIGVGAVVGVACAAAGGKGGNPNSTSQEATDFSISFARYMVSNLYAAINRGKEPWLDQFVNRKTYAKARHLLQKVKEEDGHFTITGFVSSDCGGQQCIFVLDVDYSTGSVLKSEKHTVTIMGWREEGGNESYLITGFTGFSAP